MDSEQLHPKTNGIHKSEYDKDSPPLSSSDETLDLKIVWKNVILFALLHVGAVYGLYLWLAKVMWSTFFFTWIYGVCGGLGITAGVHRLWSHKAYKARLPLRVILVYFNSISMQNSIIEWVRDHRIHHRYTDTDADPHNSKRGFFFCHMGWLLRKKHPEITAKADTIDMSDMWADPMLCFQHKYYLPMCFVIGGIIPACVPLLWGESLYKTFFACVCYRYAAVLHFTWLVNSAAHMWGYKPYDKNITPVENKLISFLAMGEGFHNFHHTFPQDYKTDELGHTLNATKYFIDVMAMIGWAYDLKVVPMEVIQNKKLMDGDGSHRVSEVTLEREKVM